MTCKQFSYEQDEWIKKHYSSTQTHRDFTAEYNAYWGENRSITVIKKHCQRLGLQKDVRHYTQEQNEWLCEHAKKYTCKETAALFNQTFSEDRTEGSIKRHCNDALRIGFRNDHIRDGCPIGTEKTRSGIVWAKVSDSYHGKGSAWVNWRQKAHIVWEQHYGCMPPKGHTIIFLDNNRQNVVIENLYAVSGVVLREMSKKQWFSTDPNLTLAAIKWCELLYTMKEINKKGVCE